MYPKVVSETDEEITYQKCETCEQDAMIELDGVGVCRECYCHLTEEKAVDNV